jgi:hypothetical protein
MKNMNREERTSILICLIANLLVPVVMIAALLLLFTVADAVAGIKELINVK